jgi:hypothetical protein
MVPVLAEVHRDLGIQRNFQSLAWPKAMHVHINHGESDKTSLVTHQARAYDRVLVAGDAAIRRLTTGLLELEADRSWPSAGRSSTTSTWVRSLGRTSS